MNDIPLHRKDWLTARIWEILDYKYSTDQIYEVVDKLPLKDFKYLARFAHYDKSKEAVEEKINQLIKEV